MRHCYELADFPKERMAPGFSYEILPREHQIRRDHLTPDVLSDAVLAWFAKYELEPTMIAFFRRYAPHHSGIHVDYSESNQCYAGINFELEGHGSQAYYEPVRGEPEYLAVPNNGRKAGNYNTAVYKPRDVRLVEHTLFQPGSAYLVQVNVPHRAFVTSDYRVAVSIRFSHKGAHEAWEDTVKRLLPHVQK